jgi:hypothetical protein
MSSIDSVSTIA